MTPHLSAYRDRSTKGPSRRGRRHDCWRVDLTENGERRHLGRCQANSAEAAIAQLAHRATQPATPEWDWPTHPVRRPARRLPPSA